MSTSFFVSNTNFCLPIGALLEYQKTESQRVYYNR